MEEYDRLRDSEREGWWRKLKLEQEVLRASEVFIEQTEELLPILSRVNLFTSEWSPRRQ